MRTKLIGLLIGVMLLTTFLTVAQPPQTTTPAAETKTMQTTASMNDVPVWELGDTWTYRVNEISMNITDEAQSLRLNFTMEQLPLTVVNTTGDFYTLTFSTMINAFGHLNTDQGDGPVNISINIDDLQIEGAVLFDKATLGLKDFSLSFIEQKKFTFTVIEQPYLTLPEFLKKLTVKVTSILDIESDTSIDILTFPMQTGITWNLSAANLTTNGLIESPLLDLIHLIDTIFKLFGMEFLPPEVADLLPVIDVKDALTLLMGSNTFQVPVLPYAFFCLNTENITVPAGIFEAFNITLLGGLGQCYFAPTAGTIILMTGQFQDVIPFVQNIDLELVSTNYS